MTELGGGEAGNAVCTARRNTDWLFGGDRGGEGGVTRGDDVRLRNVEPGSGVGDGGDAGGG